MAHPCSVEAKGAQARLAPLQLATGGHMGIRHGVASPPPSRHVPSKASCHARVHTPARKEAQGSALPQSHSTWPELTLERIILEHPASSSPRIPNRRLALLVVTLIVIHEL
ncbi:hypothetical protein KM043_003505 [Ampulex compressa]|nr:hypothetical protein KM043_003505 [Ampulex compressa]